MKAENDFIFFPIKEDKKLKWEFFGMLAEISGFGKVSAAKKIIQEGQRCCGKDSLC